MPVPAVSIIVNVRNGSATLAAALESAVRQTFADWEMIVWDDCSTDNSGEIVSSFRDSRIRYEVAPYFMSLGEARQAAMSNAVGEWIAFLDQDDIWLPGKLECQLAKARSDRVGLVYGRTVCFYANGSERDYEPGNVVNHTSRTLVLDSNIGGLHVTTFSGGGAGLHGLVVQNTLGGSNPAQLFFKDFTVDCSYGDGVVFSSSLLDSDIQAHFTQTWVAGAGQPCNGTASTNATANGIHISGGKQIYFDNGWIRANSNNGVLIDSTNVGDVHITGNMIQGNNWGQNTAPSGSGVNVTTYMGSLYVSGNQCSDSYENAYNGKKQNYCVAISKNGARNAIVEGNFTESNNTQPFIYPNPGSSGQMAFFANTNPGGDAPDNILYGGTAVFSNMSSAIAPWMIPSLGARSGFLFGFGGNLHFDGANWRCSSDTANNGCWGWLGSQDGSVGLYSIPTANPMGPQSISSADLIQYRAFSVSHGIVDLGPVTTKSLSVEGDLTIGGKSMFGSDGSISPTHLTLSDVPPGQLLAGQAGEYVTSVPAGNPGDCLVAGTQGQMPSFTSCPSGRPLSSWSLPVTGSQGIGFSLTRGIAYRAAFELPAPGVKFNTITVVVLAADLNQGSRYAVQIVGTDGSLLCSMNSRKALNAVGAVDFPCVQGTVYLPQATYTIIWSSDVVSQSSGAASKLRFAVPAPRAVGQAASISGNATAVLLG